MFWVWIVLAALAVVGLSVLFGTMLNKPPANDRVSNRRHDQLTALKASGALKHRKSNRE